LKIHERRYTSTLYLFTFTHGRMTRLSRPGWPVKYQDGIPIQVLTRVDVEHRKAIGKIVSQRLVDTDKLIESIRMEKERFVVIFLS